MTLAMDHPANRRFVTFVLDGSSFGVDILAVREVVAHAELTKVPGAPPFVRGLVNLRGQILTVVDLAVRLGLAPRPRTRESRLVVLKTSGELGRVGGELQTSDDPTAILVDRVGDVVEPGPEGIRPPPPNLGGVAAQHLEGVLRTPDGVLGVLDLQEALSQP